MYQIKDCIFKCSSLRDFFQLLRIELNEQNLWQTLGIPISDHGRKPIDL